MTCWDGRSDPWKEDLVKRCTQLKYFTITMIRVGSIVLPPASLASCTLLRFSYLNIPDLLDVLVSGSVAVTKLEQLTLIGISLYEYRSWEEHPSWGEVEQSCREKKIQLCIVDHEGNR